MMYEIYKKQMNAKLDLKKDAANNILNNSMDYEEVISSRQVNSNLSDYSLKYSKQFADARSLNFSTTMSEDVDVTSENRPTSIKDPKLHRIIEKKRRDRMNNCLADLRKLIPADYSKQGRGRIEKIEIIQMAIKHIKYLTNMGNEKNESQVGALKSNLPDLYLGFKECQDEVMRCLVEVEGLNAADRVCIMLMSHLEQAGEKFRIMNDQSLSQVVKEDQYRHADENMNQQPTVLTNAWNSSGQQTEFTNKSVHQNIKSFQPETILLTPKQDLEDSNGIPPMYPGYEQLLTVQQNTQEHLKRDSLLWTLLRSKTSKHVEDSGISVESGMSTSNSKDSRTARYMNTKAQNEVSSAFNSSPQESCSEKRDTSVYKFKHNITKRFFQEECMITKGSTSPICFREEKRKSKLKRKLRYERSQSQSSSRASNCPISSTLNNKSSSQ